MNSRARLTAFLFLATLAHQGLAQTRAAGPWWPHPTWGPEDQAGASNWITPEKIQQSAQLVKTGKLYELGHPYERGMPMVGERSYSIFIPSFPTYGPFGEDQVVFNDEYIATELGQVGTQFDGPGHVGMAVEMEDGSTEYVFYNGYQGSEMRHPYGLRKLGVENVKPIFTRGVLFDLAGYLGVEFLEGGRAISVAEIEGALRRQGIDPESIRPGDALLFNLGWWRRWPDRAMVEGPHPYLSDEAIEWIVAKQPCMVGSDLNLDGAESRVHTRLVLQRGIFNLEFMRFDGLAEDEAYEFLFVFTPLRLKGATGSPGRPIAIR